MFRQNSHRFLNALRKRRSIALIGLLGILIGEQIPPVIKQALKAERAVLSPRDQADVSMFGPLAKKNDGKNHNG